MKNLLTLSIISPLLASQASAINIVLDFDTHSSTFFSNSTARAAVQAAADDISAAITTSLNAIPANRAFTGTDGGASITITSTYNYTNPNGGAIGGETFTGTLAANEFRIFVGAQSLTGSRLGVGGPGALAQSLGGTGSGDYQAAADNASSAATATTGRGGSIITSSLGGTTSGINFNVDYAPIVGNLWFDSDGSTTWNFDHTSSSVVGSDLYSVALHEILHALGIGTYDSWEDNEDGTNWLGAEAIALHGTGTGLLHTDSDGGHAHIAENIMSARLSDGVMQEVVWTQISPQAHVKN